MESTNLLEQLQDIGLTKQQTKVYIALLELQQTKGGELAKQSGIATSNLYEVLETLIQQGLVSYKLKNNVKVFLPASPEALQEIIKEKEQKLAKQRELLPSLITALKKRSLDNPLSNYKYFEGIRGIKSMWYEINNTITSVHIMRVYTGKRDTYQRFMPLYDEHHALRVKKGVKAQLIFPLEDRDLGNKRKKQLADVRYLKLDNATEWGVWNNMFYLYHYPVAKQPYGFLIIDDAFALTFQQVFDQLWNVAQK